MSTLMDNGNTVSAEVDAAVIEELHEDQKSAFDTEYWTSVSQSSLPGNACGRQCRAPASAVSAGRAISCYRIGYCVSEAQG